MKPFAHLMLWVLIVGASGAGYGYWYTVIADKSVAVANLQNEIDAKTEAAGRIAAARAALAQIASDEAAIQRYFVPESGVVSFINDLEARASAQTATLRVVSVSTGGPVKQPTLTFALSIDGGFDAVMRTIGAIEFAPYYLSLSRLALSENGKGVWHADIGIVVGSVAAATATSTPVVAPKTLSMLPLHFSL